MKVVYLRKKQKLGAEQESWDKVTGYGNCN
jgi:hypothetical protein